ncbi:sigma-54 interaction domain-containing protein [Thalassoglobus polymorphus]|uniref:Transcriptional regulatory protein ZraR n=1 Tax=Thalassoglobus polymorphus TaxID=2527994 RepID=A0A517QNW4_9PLAN|nr:sigma-54 dependent transcriptional regulator [Thalassoglobus polymorphus]QDT33313.1 Transcriptional regulatory protein ZraR [Thalassoglobus polymorphus]
MSIIFQSQCINELLDRTKRFAKSSAAILITGETGTGKELLARAIHEFSNRSMNPYLQVNCAALSEQLIESELFGHETGAFTGATMSRQGRLEVVENGTLFLDEIGELPIGTQAKLLRVLEEREYQRVGSNQNLKVNARIVAATNRLLDQEVRERRFREDLLHRINVLCLDIPPLRERRDDIPPLVTHFLKRFQSEGEFQVLRVSSSVMKQLCEHDWPGNVRELRNTVLKSCVLAQGPEITAVEFPTPTERDSFEDELPASFLKLPLEEIERRVILMRLSQNEGNKSAAAETLGVTSRTLRNKMDRYRKLGYVA